MQPWVISTGDGLDDLLVGTAVDDAVPNLEGEWIIGARGCTAMRSATGGYAADCSAMGIAACLLPVM